MRMCGKETDVPPGTEGGVVINGKNGTGGVVPPGGWQPLPQRENGKMALSVEDDPANYCGLGPWRPKWLQQCASTHFFMVVFLSGWILQGVFYTYFVSVITTIEKLFQIKSRTTGMILATSEVGQISTALFLTYFAGTGHRPRWIACGMVLFAIGCFGCALPHFIFGTRLLAANSVIHGTSGNDSSELPPVCGRYGSSTEEMACEASVLEGQIEHAYIMDIVLPIFYMCLFCVGVGQTAIQTLGIPYIDDNVASKDSPIYLAVTIAVRIIGPAGGFILGSITTRIYVDLETPPGLQPTDPHWISAWWLGLVLVSSLLGFTGLIMFCFPRELPGSKVVQAAKIANSKNGRKHPPAPKKAPQLKDFPRTLKRQISNDILMLKTASVVLHLLPVAGVYTFLPKYLESQFHLAPYDANLVSGIGGILVMGVGIILSGGVILKLVPTARMVAAWIAFTAFAYSMGMLLLMFLGCPMQIVGVNSVSNIASRQIGISDSLLVPKGLTEPFACPSLSTCNCENKKFNAVCGQDGITYYSPCHAGCTNVSLIHQQLVYFNCQCIQGNGNYSTSWDSPHKQFVENFPDIGIAKSGYCTGNCSNFVIFICIFSFIMFIHATGEVGSILFIMRCTDPKDKAMAMGILQFVISLFGNVPCPIIFGAVVDSACLIWDTVCNSKGACWLYDTNAFRTHFLGTTAGIMGIAFFVDVTLWFRASRIDINPEGDVSDIISTKSIDCNNSRTIPQDMSTIPLTSINQDITA